MQFEMCDDKRRYTSDDTPMVQYLNLSHVINNQRDVARDNNQPSGPCIALVGPTDVGKSSLAKVLVNYAIRSGWSPVLVDTDVGQGMLTVPGCVAASTIETPIDPEDGLYTDAPAAFFFGHTTPSANFDLYRTQVDRFANPHAERMLCLLQLSTKKYPIRKQANCALLWRCLCRFLVISYSEALYCSTHHD